MSKKGFISRYLLILKKLKQQSYSSFEELRNYIETQQEFLQLHDETIEIGFSQRTLQRDIREIRNLFGIDIKHSKKDKGYFILHTASENMNFQRMLEAFDIFNSLNIAQDLQGYLHLEKQNPKGTEHLYGIIHAIKNRRTISFHYKKFWQEESSIRKVEVYALKEFKNRWYILVKDKKDDKIKTFALDRISNLDILNEFFAYPITLNISEVFKNSFGIINPFDDSKPQTIILSFDAFQGKYIKTLPLHHSQKILSDTPSELKIELTLFITHDLIMEILSFGSSIKVLSPESLKQDIKTILNDSLRNYK